LLHFHAKEKLNALTRQIKVDALFTGYRIQSNAANIITMALPSDALLAALKSASSSASTASETEEVIMKLAKKNGQAVLSFEINGLTRVGRKVRVAHDVKIEVMRPADVERLSEPLCPEPDVRFNFNSFACGLG
jgi:HUS1 checkpoint protein